LGYAGFSINYRLAPAYTYPAEPEVKTWAAPAVCISFGGALEVHPEEDHHLPARSVLRDGEKILTPRQV